MDCDCTYRRVQGNIKANKISLMRVCFRSDVTNNSINWYNLTYK